MTNAEPWRGGAIVKREWRAPAEHGQAVVVPAWEEAPGHVTANQTRFAQMGRSPTGLDWSAWRVWCRAACEAAAIESTTRDLGATAGPVGVGPLIVGGHQPELFHPGVWAKNYALDRLARRVGGTSLHLIVDSDASTQSSVMVPVGTRVAAKLEPLPFDAPRPQQPWETTGIQQVEVFESFATRLSAAMRPWGITPIVEQAWPTAIATAHRTGKLATALTAARVEQERRWGLANLELPLSRVCVLPPFLRFAAELFARLPEFVPCHNAILAEYRRVNHVRSRAHPVPELSREGDWWEAPFWVWREGETLRDRPWARLGEHGIELRDRHGVIGTMPPVTGRGDAAVAALATWAARGIHLRTRALTTTMFARLGLADLFVHGLGGAKYDEMTDALIARFFGLEPPTFLTVSATLHSPYAGASNFGLAYKLADGPRTGIRDACTFASLQSGELRQAIRRRRFHPTRYLPQPLSGRAAVLEAELGALAEQLDRSQAGPDEKRGDRRAARRRLYLRHQAVLAELASLLAPEIDELQARHDRLLAYQAQRRVLLRRDFSWVTFPERRMLRVYRRLFGRIG